MITRALSLSLYCSVASTDTQIIITSSVTKVAMLAIAADS